MEILLSPPVLLTLAVIFVNGWTDAPNAIATAVGTGALRMGRAIALAAVCNLLGAVLSAALCPAVAATVLEIGDFIDVKGNAPKATLYIAGYAFAVVRDHIEVHNEG